MIFFETEADPTNWFLMPLHWTELDQDKIEDWSRTCAEIMSRRHRKWWRSPNKDALTTRFRLLVESHPHPAIPADQVFLYGGDPRRIPQVFYALAVRSDGGDRRKELLTLVQADKGNDVKPPEVETFHSDRMGDGLRCLQYFDDAGQVCVSLNYGWWSEEHQTYASLRTVTGDLGWLMSLIDEWDDFARSIWLNSNPQ
ncbi:hypothetical protein [Streptomyces griseomycini]|uniref:Uncharacterized protein n=1 Tax=Streptomyces griseomycini TaxID=66895 RepID=A0A7W7LWF9_9ACTN|nr:hypothetical protein [Streptomyces griseomycini]MBB4897743.1 hypothetical protein [Streptomyces griseomycini]GGQ20439.1 hypothetical protein GCM10010266_49500 [Streptomyces griseomycini]GGR11689.1 hypothetical protein GCM10015536_16490 [Streptomyces griseomycini]